MTGPVTRETATVYRAPNGRRYLTRRAAFGAIARERMRRDHEEDSSYSSEWGFYTAEPCHCSWCRDVLRMVWHRYTRLLMRRARAAEAAPARRANGNETTIGAENDETPLVGGVSQPADSKGLV